ncbi:hypothetical protein ACERK3_01595 [Phycisphaerales bacterium AB-hyl4]|uniref:D-isomer specific 2-hydroxyacid dehydrogenase catalytic domain-containing protein n=1 Tax=Natronomicrosphaera hydrolytica TaxID=3242702 RepID=A0ABV4U0S8_9BACT
MLADLAEVEAFNATSEAQLVDRIEDADAIMLYHNLGLSRRTIERLNCCKLTVRCGVGYDDFKQAKRIADHPRINHFLCRDRFLQQGVGNSPHGGRR